MQEHDASAQLPEVEASTGRNSWPTLGSWLTATTLAPNQELVDSCDGGATGSELAGVPEPIPMVWRGRSEPVGLERVAIELDAVPKLFERFECSILYGDRP